jgi:hypothetical protein
MKTKKRLRLHQHFFPIIDELVHSAVREVEAEGHQISCRKGCHHCCYLLVEISWEEAVELAHWVAKQSDEKRPQIIQQVKQSAKQVRRLFNSLPGGKKYAGAIEEHDDIPDELYDQYFYQKKLPCAFLVDGCCSAYPARPSACRLHLVTSDPNLCRSEVIDDTDYEIPHRIEELRDEVGPINSAICKDGRWGQLAILVEMALTELGIG